MNDKKRHIAASINEATVNMVNELAKKENRSFSSMIETLVMEAVEKRNSKKQTKK